MNEFDLMKALGMDSQFLPNYQGEYPLEFAALADYYMERYYDFNKEPDLYWQHLCHAVKFANKSIMLQRLELPDIESYDRDLFKSTFAEIAKRDDDLIVKGSAVTVSDNLRKSIDGDNSRNVKYERVWKDTFDTITTKLR
jgi:hypothetical protein